MRSQAPTTVIAVIITLCTCAIAFLAYLMWSSKNDSPSVATPTATVTTTSIATETVTETPSTVTVTSAPSSTAQSSGYAAEGEPCTADELNDQVAVGRRTLICTYQGEEATNEYEWEYLSTSY
ncbi:hypothetical protein [Gordonia sp. CPCC 205333]|uniref:hypothetical protein n=1 Tax=Gordonia sp. CPCC 205333 TaxID=3140790 RepID=UPI003AF3DAF6